MQDIAVFSARQTEPDSLASLVSFAQDAGVKNYSILSDPPATNCALEAACPTDWPVEDIRTQANRLRIDVNKLPADERRKKLLLADMDATIICGESLDELAKLAGIEDKIQPITAKAMAGELDFEDALITRLALLAGQPTSLLDDVVQNTVVNVGADQLVATMRTHGSKCYLISGGFTFLTQEIAKILGFDDHHANVMAVHDGRLTGQVVPPILGKSAKREFLEQYIAKHHLTPDETLCVGDGANDLAMLSSAGMGVAFNGKPTLREKISLQLNHTDLSGLLYLQGYRFEDFAIR